MNCPRCSIPMEEEILKVFDFKENLLEVTVDACPKCKGVWLQKGELKTIQTESLLSMAVKVFKRVVQK